MLSPPVSFVISDWVSALPRSMACFTALKTISSRNSTSFGSTTSLSILIAMTSPAPFAVTFTLPPPALTSTIFVSSSACVLAICSCIFCACFMSLFKFISLGSGFYLSLEQLDGFLDERVVFEILGARSLVAFRSRCVLWAQFITYGEFHDPVFSSNFLQESLKKFAIRLRAQNLHHCFLVRRKTKSEIASFNSKHVGCGRRISEESLLWRNFCAELLPHLRGVDIGAQLRRLVT